jgi:23S rRNA (cytidine1920-2'-O)/16S rRNA (cytidine1409-2'-O)-methyltransferase
VGKKRLDHLILERWPNYSRQQIQSWIMQGKVSIEGIPVTKSGQLVADNAHIELILDEPKYVSRAGFKLEKALDHFALEVAGLTVLDAGLSTGGFTHCLLQHGAARVIGVDVGYGQVHEKIRNDKRVTVMERTNLRSVRNVGSLVDLVTLDLSFISVLKVLDAVTAVLKPTGGLLVLIKPQFEAGRHEVRKGGIVQDAAVHRDVIERVTKGIIEYGFALQGVIESPIEGTMGNKEFLAYFIRTIG